MSAARKKWSTTTIPSIRRKSHPSQAAAYRYVRSLGVEFHAGMLHPDLVRVSVWVDGGSGRWELYEVLKLEELPGVVTER